MNLSIVTVCYNAAATIEATFQSVLEQDYIDYEYIVIDGKSQDETPKLALQYKEEFLKKGVHFQVVSESDKGIYDAMNKAIRLAQGTWIYFLNADDSLYAKDTLSNVFSRKVVSDYDVIYGRVLKIKGATEEMRSHDPVDTIVRRLPFCHQGAFTKTIHMKKELFDLQYTICADYNFFLHIYLQGKQFLKIDTIIAKFSMNGLSSNHFYKMLKEGYRIRDKNGVLGWKEKLYANCYRLPVYWIYSQKKKWLTPKKNDTHK